MLARIQRRLGDDARMGFVWRDGFVGDALWLGGSLALPRESVCRTCAGIESFVV